MGKKQTKNRSIWTYELRSMIAGWVLAFLCVLVFIGDTQSIVGKTLITTMVSLFGDYYKGIFVLYGLLALGLIVGKLFWNSARVIGILLSGISLTTLIAMYSPYASHGVLDFSSILIAWLGKWPMVIALIGGLLISVFLMLRISYRQVLAAVQSSLPSGQSVRDAMVSVVRESPPPSPAKSTSAATRKKELDHELELARAARSLEAQREDSAPSVVKGLMERLIGSGATGSHVV